MENNSKAFNLFKSHPNAAAVISKLNTTETEEKWERTKRGATDLDRVYKVGQSIYNKIKSNHDIVDLFPDIELCGKIIVSAIVSPNDLLTTNINIKSPNNLKIPESIKELINTTIKDYLEEHYELEKRLYNIVYESLFTRGAYIEAIIPEASVDTAINKPNLTPNNSESVLTEGYERYRHKEANERAYDKDINFLGTLSSESINKLQQTLDVITADIATEASKINAFSNESFKLGISNEKDRYSLNISIGNENRSIPIPDITDNIYQLRSRDNTLSEMSLALENNLAARFGFTNNKVVEMGTREESAGLSNFFKMIDSDIANQEDITIIPGSAYNSRPSIGRPMRMVLPTESVIPVTAIGDKTKHIGYFVLLDENGFVLDYTNKNNFDAETINTLANGVTFTEAETSNMMSRAKYNLHGVRAPDEVLEKNNEIYVSIIKNIITERIRNGYFKDLVELNDNANIYNLMFHRAMKAKGTKMLFLPAELVQYFAFEYRENGTGKSMIEKAEFIYSLRGTLFIADLIAKLKNTMNTTEINIELDELDQYQQETLENIIELYIRNREPYNGLGLTNLNDIYQWIISYGYKVNIQAEGLPTIKTEINDVKRDVNGVESDTLEQLKEMGYATFGLTPELVDKGKDVDLATTIINKQLFLAKETMSKQLILNKHLSEYIRKVIKYDMSLRELLVSRLEAQKSKILNSFKNTKMKKVQVKTATGETKEVTKEVADPAQAAKVEMTNDEFKKVISYIIDLYIRKCNVHVPELELGDSNVQANAIKDKFSEIDEIIDAVVGETAIAPLVGDNSEAREEITNRLKQYYKKKFLMENNFKGLYANIADLFVQRETIGLEDGAENPFITTLNDLKHIALQYLDSMSTKSAIQEAFRAGLENVVDGLIGMNGASSSSMGSSGGSSDSGGDSGGGDDGGDSGGDDGGDMDFGSFGDDFGGGEGGGDEGGDDDGDKDPGDDMNF